MNGYVAYRKIIAGIWRCVSVLLHNGVDAGAFLKKKTRRSGGEATRQKMEVLVCSLPTVRINVLLMVKDYINGR